MKNKFLLSIAAAAAITLTGAATNHADASTLCPSQPTVMQFSNYQDLTNYLNTHYTNYKVTYKPCYGQAPDRQTAAPVQPQSAPAQAKAAPTQAKAAPAQAKPAQTPAQPASSNQQLSAYEQKVVELTNVERSKQGLAALKVDTQLSKVARIKSQDMHDKKYFDHNSPTYGSPFDMMKQFGVSYRSAGENIAQGQRTPEEVVKAWMNSSGHRANILNSGFTHIGVGYVADGSYWTQQFISK